MCAKANLSTAFLPDFVNKLQLKLQCGLKRFDNKKDLIDQIYIWETERNKKIVKANWQFTKEGARVKLKNLYPSL